MSESSLVKLRHISKSFFGTKVLNNIDFEIGRGEVRCLIGENGCGKSTMIKVISGYYEFDEGELFINGKKYLKITPSESMREGIQVIYQDFALFPNMSVAENIMMTDFMNSSKHICDWKDMKQQSHEVMDYLGINLNAQTDVSELGVAEKQLVAICRAFVQDAKLIIMDEPTTALTSKEIEKLYKIINKMVEKGISILFISHKLDELKRISDSLTIMRNGENVYDGECKKLTNNEIVYYMTGREFSDQPYKYTCKDRNPLIKIENLCSDAFQNISFELYKGEILGITGLLGCGRTELAKALFGMYPYSSGKIILHGEHVEIKNVTQALEHKIGYIPEDRLTEGLHMERTIDDNLMACTIEKSIKRTGMIDKKEISQRIKKALEKIKIEGYQPNKAVRNLSGGNQQKVVLLKWLEFQPDIFILNCPTVGVDVGAKSIIHALMKEIGSDGMGLIVISDDIPEIMQVCNRVLVMRKGKIIGEKEICNTTEEEIENMLLQDAI